MERPRHRHARALQPDGRGPGDTGTGPRLAQATYTATPTDKPTLRWAGQVTGRAPAGQVLYFVGTADPSTIDGTPEHNQGGENIFLIGQLNPDSNGCWTAGPRTIYDCAGGIKFIYHLLQMPTQQARSLEQRKNANTSIRENGFDPGEFHSLPITFIDSFDVPTQPGPGCRK